VWLAGLDLGATFVKAAVLDVDGPCLREVVRVPFPPFAGPPPARELDAASVVELARGLLDRLIDTHPGCAGIAVCGQMHGLVLADGDGAAASPFVSWQDGRGLAEAWPRVREAVDEATLARWGRELKPAYPLVTLVRLRPDPGLTPAALPDFVAASLCGVRPVQEATNASGMGGFDVAARAWDGETIARLGLDGLAWADVCDHRRVVGEYRGLPVHAAVGDQQSSLLGVFLAEDELSLNVATGSQASRIAAGLERGAGQTRPFFERTLRTVTHIPAGRSLNALARLLTELGGPEEPWPQIERLAAQAGPPRLRADLSFFPAAYGEQGELVGIVEEELTVGSLFRAAFAGMAEQYARAAGEIGAAGAARVVLSGGLGRRSAALQEEVARRLPLPQRTTRHDEDALAGLLALALVHAGRAADTAEAAAMLREVDDRGELL
jgi:sugar (pentulose or hexulose) kinase